MAEFFNALDDKHREFIARQPMFFVGTAAADGRVNVSPKGYDAFRILGPNRVAYLDLGGSGNETHAHLSVDGRITIMFCAFDRTALIMRLYGHGRAVMPGDPAWDELAPQFEIFAGTRQIFDIAVDSVQTSCGWGVPVMSLERERPTLKKAHAQTEPELWVEKNQRRTHSIDGIPVTPPDRYLGAKAD